jgi:hypothetical protein
VQDFHGVVLEGALLQLTTHSPPLQSATLLSQHHHYLRWPNLPVLLRFTFSFVYKVHIGFLSCMRDWTVAVAQYSKFAC